MAYRAQPLREHRARVLASTCSIMPNGQSERASTGCNPTHRQLRRYLSQLEQAQYSRATVNRRLSAVPTFFQWLNVNGIVSEDPASALSGPSSRSVCHIIFARKTLPRC